MPDATDQTYSIADLTDKNFANYNFYNCEFPNGKIRNTDFHNCTFDSNCHVTGSGTCTFHLCNVTNTTAPSWAVFEFCNRDITDTGYALEDIDCHNLGFKCFKNCVFPNGKVYSVNFTNSTFDANCSSIGTLTVIDSNCTNVTKPDWMTFVNCNNKQGVDW